MNSIYSIEIIAQNEHTVRFRLKENESYLSFKEVFNLWQQNVEFVKFYKNELLNLKYQAFYWEHPALNKGFLNKRYECILQRSRPLEHLPIDERSFRDYLFQEAAVTDFMNLGKDARLVIPTKKTDKEIYNHFGKFLRFAAEEQIIAVFKSVGKTILEEIETQKLIWLNTEGTGVIWLHIRMDTKPKYYKTVRYKEPDFLNALE